MALELTTSKSQSVWYAVDIRQRRKFHDVYARESSRHMGSLATGQLHASVIINEGRLRPTLYIRTSELYHSIITE